MKKIIFIICILFFCACTSHVADMTAISTRDINPNEIDLNKLPMTPQVEGSHTAVATIFTFWKHTNLSKALEDALDKGNGDLMINAHVTMKKYFIVIGFINTIKIKGDVINTMGEEVNKSKGGK